MSHVAIPPGHRVHADGAANVVHGRVRFSAKKSVWLSSMAGGAIVGGAATITGPALLVFVATTVVVLLFGHSLGSHRKLIHGSFQCPRWLELLLVWFGVQVGLAGPIGLLRQHELRDFAQRLPTCHDYLRHGSSFWRDAWWQLFCDLELDSPPITTIEARIANDPFLVFLERTWMLQQLIPALLLFAWGGWAFVFWGVCARVTAGVVGHWLIGHLAHNRGGMHYTIRGAAVQGRNIRFSALLTMGESWHNNHHAFPGSARLGLFPGEWDPGWWMLCVMHRVGLVWNLRLPEHLPRRVELESCAASRGIGRPSTSDHPAPLDTRLAWRACWSRCTSPPSHPVSMTCFVEGPAAHLSVGALRSLSGPRLPFRRNAQASRLVLYLGDRHIEGLPVLCVALSVRSRLMRPLGVALLPFAITVETLRRFFSMIESPTPR